MKSSPPFRASASSSEAMTDTQSSDDLAAHLRALEEKLHDPAFRASSAGGLLADDFHEIGRSGHMWDRRTIIEALADETASPEPVRASSYALTRLSETVALLTYRTQTHHGITLRSSIWRCEEGGWKLAFHQGTPAAADILL